jgi:hypothetical protein
MKPLGPEAPVVLVKWYDYSKWLLERVENFPKSQRFVLGQRLSEQAMDVLRWTVRMAKDRKLFTAAQFEFSARALPRPGGPSCAGSGAGTLVRAAFPGRW